ncbi:MAG: mevalonate kinase [Thermoproteota archaeon]|nr:MAG: mevalonate kinase [Candidatus Korarchaeota archaeon]
MPDRVMVSAPSQAFLFGEHAVLYKSRALACGVERRSKAELKVRGDRIVKIDSDAYPGEYIGKIESGGIRGEGPKELEILARGLSELYSKYEFDKGVEIRIWSDIPVGSGMASSASVSACIVRGFSVLAGIDMSKEDILENVYMFERIIHGRASKTGPACAVYGGIVLVEWVSNGMVAKRVDLKVEIPLVICCVKARTPTSVMISKVADRVKRVGLPMRKIMETVDLLIDAGLKAMENGDLKLLGELMLVNQGLLWAMGVSTSEIDRVINVALENGAYGGKLSGGGGGGCVLILSGAECTNKIIKSLQTIGYKPFRSSVSVEGVKVLEVTS